MKVKSEELRQEIFRKLAEKCPKPQSCAFCGHREWLVVDIITEIREFYEKALSPEAKRMPVIPIMCNYCGYMVFINAIRLGVNLELLSEEEVKK